MVKKIKYTRTFKYAWSHVGEWSDFFNETTQVTNEEVEAFIKKHRKSKYLKQSLERLEKNGFLKTRKNTFTPTKKGTNFFKRLFLRKRMSEMRNAGTGPWDGKWRLITFDVPVKRNKERKLLSYLLRDLGFYQIQKSVLVFPNQITEEVWKFLVDQDLSKYCKIMLVDFIEGDKEIKRHFFGKA